MEIQTKRRLSSTVSLIELETAISREKNKLTTDDKIISVCQLFWISHQNIGRRLEKQTKKKVLWKKNFQSEKTIVTLDNTSRVNNSLKNVLNWKELC